MSKKSVTTVLKGEGLTSLKILYNYKTGDFWLEAMKEWEPDLDFATYNKAFYCTSLLTKDVKYYNTYGVEELFAKYGLTDYLEEIKQLLREGRHFGIEMYYNEGYDILFMSHQHSRKLGINNRQHATLAGGIRRHAKEDEEIEVIIDGLNLGRAMSFKNVAGRIPCGGCKQTVTMDPIDLNNLQHVGFLAFCADRCRLFSGPDMNFPTALADAVRRNFSVYIQSGPETSYTGESGKPTAYGIYKTLKQAVRYYENTESIADKSATLIGLGAVGWHLGVYLLQEVKKLYISDLSEDRAQQFKDAFPDKDIEIVPLDTAYFTPCDVLVPCAIGGVFDEETISKLNCKYIWGSANNQLKASGAEEEIRLAKLLKERGIVFQVEWWHNTAGVMHGWVEYFYNKRGTDEIQYNYIDSILPESTYNNLKEADERGITPTENAYRITDEVIYGDATLEFFY